MNNPFEDDSVRKEAAELSAILGELRLKYGSLLLYESVTDDATRDVSDATNASKKLARLEMLIRQVEDRYNKIIEFD